MRVPDGCGERLDGKRRRLAAAQPVAPAEAQQRGDSRRAGDVGADRQERVGDPVLGLVVGIGGRVEEGGRGAELHEGAIYTLEDGREVHRGLGGSGDGISIGDELYPAHK